MSPCIANKQGQSSGSHVIIMHTLPTLSQLPEVLQTRVVQQLAVLQQHASPELTATLAMPLIQASLPLVWASSEFVMNACMRKADFLPALVNNVSLLDAVDINRLRELLDQALASSTNDAELQSSVRRFRQHYMARIAWRDIAGWATLNETLLDSSNLADVCVQAVYQHAYASLSALYGTPIGRDSNTPQHLMILGMGKLGGTRTELLIGYRSDLSVS